MKQLLILLAGAWLLAGCASPDVNPPAARADVGYVDFYTIGGADLNWEVARFGGRSQRYKIVFSELKPLADGVLRLALPPGRHHLRLTFLNRVIRQPSEFEVEVAAGMVIPVHVVLTEDAFTQVESMEQSPARHASYSDISPVYRVSTVINSPIPYRVKEQLPYAH